MSKSWSERGSAAIDAGDLDTAKQCFARAVRSESRNAQHRFHLAIVLEGLDEVGAAAEQLTHALRLDPTRQDASRRLAALHRRTQPGAFDQVDLSPIGLRHALHHDRIDRQAIANIATRRLSRRPPLQDILAMGSAQGWQHAARALCLSRSASVIKDELFLDLLHTTTLPAVRLERLLTEVRRVLLLELPPDRLVDRSFVTFAVALLQQCWTNEFVWFASDEETRVLAAAPIDPAKLATGDLGEGWRLLKHALYRPLDELLGGRADADLLAAIQPPALRDAILGRLALQRDERERAARLPQLGAIADATSRKVAGFYEASPYPRWSSLSLQRDYPAALARFLGRDRIDFFARPFEVLIAGCGTGQHAIQSALQYGPNARILALDLSAASLSYAARMADRFGIESIRFARADLAQVDSFGPEFTGRFHIIEAVGVLHHMANPFASWRALLGCLAPGGLMRIGLYSAIARRSLTALHADPAYPGAGCDNGALRAFRRELLDRQDEPARYARNFIDFWDSCSFRDLLLHVSERCITLDEIARFLEAERLVFRGLELPRHQQALFWQRHPAEPWPGTLQQWAAVEADHPALFQNMYRFWCERRIEPTPAGR